ncbi:hypothetical protein RQP46_007338 [Phenoliferia psychrophenolica]
MSYCRICGEIAPVGGTCSRCGGQASPTRKVPLGCSGGITSEPSSSTSYSSGLKGTRAESSLPTTTTQPRPAATSAYTSRKPVPSLIDLSRSRSSPPFIPVSTPKAPELATELFLNASRARTHSSISPQRLNLDLPPIPSAKRAVDITAEPVSLARQGAQRRSASQSPQRTSSAANASGLVVGDKFKIFSDELSRSTSYNKNIFSADPVKSSPNMHQSQSSAAETAPLPPRTRARSASPTKVGRPTTPIKGRWPPTPSFDSHPFVKPVVARIPTSSLRPSPTKPSSSCPHSPRKVAFASSVSHVDCSICHLPLGPGPNILDLGHSGTKVHGSCFVCDACGSRIAEGAFRSAGNKCFHPECVSEGYASKEVSTLQA